MQSGCIHFSALLFALLSHAVPAYGGDFSFFATLRAGRPANGDWEIGLGSNSAASQSTGTFEWNIGNSHWRNGNQPQNFQIGYQASSQSAYITVWDAANTPRTTVFANTGAPLGAEAVWTLPAANFFVSAANLSRPTSINVENLTLAPGVQILSGSLPVSLGASQPPATQTTPMSAPLIFNPASNGGDWFISGTIRFAGLVSTGGPAQGSALQFFLGATGTDTPEAGTGVLLGIGLLLAGIAGRVRKGF